MIVWSENGVAGSNVERKQKADSPVDQLACEAYKGLQDLSLVVKRFLKAQLQKMRNGKKGSINKLFGSTGY